MVQPVLLQPNQVYYVELRSPPKVKESLTLLDKVKYVVGLVLAVLGLALLTGVGVSFGAHFLGRATPSIEALHTLFMTGMVAAIGGFHFAQGVPVGTEITAGPIAVTI